MSKRTLESTMAEDQKVEESSKKGESASKSESKDNSNSNNNNNNNNNNSEVECDQPPKKRQRQSASGEGESQDNTIANMSKSGFPGALSLFENDGLWDSLNSEMNQMNQRMNAMAQHMESRMQQSFAQMEKEMNEEMKKAAAAAAEAEAVSSNENDDNSKSHFHSFETHSFYDSNGHRVSHARSHEKRSDGKESIKEEKRIGNKRRLTQKSRNNDKSEWNIEEKTENIGDNQQAMLEFESTFDRIFGKKENKQKAIENKK